MLWVRFGLTTVGPTDTNIQLGRLTRTRGAKRMSLHRSLKASGAIRKKRNVLKRFERIDILKEEGRLKEGEKVWGLPKTKPTE